LEEKVQGSGTNAVYTMFRTGKNEILAGTTAGSKMDAGTTITLNVPINKN
jgi:hypothetical protein